MAKPDRNRRLVGVKANPGRKVKVKANVTNDRMAMVALIRCTILRLTVSWLTTWVLFGIVWFSSFTTDSV